jgi:hypothetical protein
MVSDRYGGAQIETSRTVVLGMNVAVGRICGVGDGRVLPGFGISANAMFEDGVAVGVAGAAQLEIARAQTITRKVNRSIGIDCTSDFRAM